MTRFIGDIHGKTGQYLTIIEEAPNSVQVGDLGVGFIIDEQLLAIDSFHEDNIGHTFIRGNHDNPAICKSMRGWIPDGQYDPATGTMYIGGAHSIDYAQRVEGVTWWRDEEVSYGNFIALQDRYEQLKPKVMITHDAPTSIPPKLELLNPAFGGTMFTTRTGQALEAMFAAHKPDLWIFGHWHINADKVVDGTRFICLSELSYIDIDIDKL